MKWYNLADIHRDKRMRDAFSSYRGRIARTHAQHARHIDLPRETIGRPQRVTLLTAEGVRSLYEPLELVPDLKPFQPPMRLTDKARAYIVQGGVEMLFTTQGLEKKPRELTREQFIAFLVEIGNETLIEPDFVKL